MVVLSIHIRAFALDLLRDVPGLVEGCKIEGDAEQSGAPTRPWCRARARSQAAPLLQSGLCT